MRSKIYIFILTAFAFVFLTTNQISAQVVTSGAGVNPAAIQAPVDVFRASLGTLNPNVSGSFGTGRREINWDGVPDALAAPNNLPANFFNVNSPRGAVFSTPGTGFQVSATAASGVPINFGNINPAYIVAFAPFSPQRLFTPIGSNVTDVNFFIPGTTTPALVRGFGSVFSDVDFSNLTQIQYFDVNNVSLGIFSVPSFPGNQTFSFLGVSFPTAIISRVRITSGNQVLAPSTTAEDLVVMDDFIYGEPMAIPVWVADLATVTADDCNSNELIDPNENITISLGIQNVGTTNSTNLVATLQATGGVTNPGGPQNYGVVVAGGPAIFRSFTFTSADIVCGQPITITLQLQDGATDLGTISYNISTGTPSAVTSNYSSGNIAVPIPDVSTVDIPLGISDVRAISDINVKFRINHTFDGDLEISLVHPDGTIVQLVNHRGGAGANFGTGANDCTGTFTVIDDESPATIASGTAPFSGSYRPESSLSVLDGKLSNGTWKLRISDEAALDNGTAGCFQLDIQSFTCCIPNVITVIAAGSTIVTEGCTPANSAIDPGETVTVSFCVQNTGSLNTSNLVGTLQATGGVTSPSGSQTYGIVTAGGAPVCRNFTFTANGVCGGTITATIQLQDGSTNLGTITYTLTLGGTVTSTSTFANATPIIVPGTGTSGPASPYPSLINVAGITSPVSKVTVTLKNLNHTFPDDIDVLLVGPGGQRLILMSDAGGGTDLVNNIYTFDDAAPTTLADGALSPSGTYKPSNFGTGDTYPAPAPVGPYTDPQLLSVFNGINPNGTWSLYALDDVGGDIGNINEGWELNITTSAVTCCSQPPPPCTPTTTTTEGDLFPGGLAAFSVTSGAGSVTIDPVDVGTGFQSLTVVGIPINAVVTIPPFVPGTFNPVTVTFTVVNPALPVDFTLRAATTFNAIFIRVRCTPPPLPPCTSPSVLVTEGDLFPGGPADFGVISGPGSVTVDHINAGTGLQSLTVIGVPTNAVVNIPAFMPGTFDPVTVTFTVINPALPVDFTLRAASTFKSIFIRVRCNPIVDPCAAGNDIVPPSITCPANLTVQCPSQVPAPNLAAVMATDNCPGLVTITNIASGLSNQTCANRFTITRTYRATDAAGNTADCFHTITVDDQTPPSITACPANITVQCASQVPAPNPASVSATDNCGGTVVVTFVNDVITNQTCANRFTVTRTYRATDACGNSADCIQTITVNDQTPPLITACPANITVQCASLVPAPNPASVSATDNCGGTVIVTFVGDVITNQTCANRFTVTRTYRATDACGNSADCTQTITVNDQTVPTLSCPAGATVSCASQVPAPNIALVTGISDNCSGTVTVSHVGDVITNQTCANRFTLTRTYRATDVCGNFAECTQVFTVNDLTAPTLTCPAGATVSCASQVPAANIALVTGVSDNCSGAVTVSHVGDVITNQTCANRFTLTRTYRATDVCGNFAECTQVFTVNDQTAPVITCPSNMTVTTPIGSCVAVVNFTVTATDNCGGAVTINSVPASGSNFQIGTTTVVSTATDVCGNVSTCSFTVTVLDGQLPVITTQPVNRTVCTGTTATFSVVSTNAVSYQWQQFIAGVWTNVTGATGASFSVTNPVQSMNTNTFRVNVIGLCTTVPSAAATLFVNPLPTISLTSSNPAVLLPGQTTSIVANVNPTGGTFAWFKNGVARLPTVTTGTLSNLTVDDAGTYYAVYTDLNGCVATSANLVISAEASNLFFVAPNPNTGRFWVRYYNQLNEPLTVIVFDSKGRRVHQQTSATTLPYTQVNIDMGVKAGGIYVVELRGADGRRLGAKKIIVGPR